ncbi:MAG: pseudaminic acid cytidylyltransferase [Methylococcaceae bacterium]|nr:pseudaminic acid cytidylyltransferase [Methylococcaceae bacterium]MDZ4158095.1 pseudaminic acid cytidylyltransferase [Methylococcales bacterium]MDP2392886.1 pseudaminic acid cytidylyltransferase [Methylococcaceae bacterium]MDP3020414.1 pseudaminic acid cytidylyltransferase [Methylococcaceae bacterium]MDP3390899.1 pseudaminic acid cytidylyltransferase [Methylococcaceae bacterium]
MKIAIIPARGGSKRIPRKNIKLFCGKPMIAWSIEVAKASGLFDRIIVSTDDIEISEVAKQWGAEVPFMRPVELADDFAGTTEVIAHATQWVLDQGFNLKAICCIYATAPFLQESDLKRALQALESSDWAYAFTVTDFAAPIFRAFKQTPNSGVEMFFPEHFTTRSQDLPDAFHDAGQFYWGRPSAWIGRLRIFDHHSLPVMIPRWRVQDIDTLDDWLRAEIIFKQILESK